MKLLNKESGMKYLGVFLTLALVSLAFLKTAWVSEDAYISFRSIDNFLSGYGLRWNIDERVMVFTHPLWVLLLIPLVAVIKSYFASALILSFVFTMLSTWILCVKVATTNWGRVFVGVALVASMSFASYSSSGLENPLLHFFVSLAIWRLSTGARTAHKEGLFWGLIVALAFLTRPDAVLIFMPMAIYAFWQCPPGSWHAFGKWAITGLLPALVWVIFATIYFGSPLPNTFNAKVVSGISYSDNIQQGLWYLYETAWRDPAGAALILVATLMGLRASDWAKPLAFSALLYCMYIVWVGGDFMAGRFISVLVLLSVGGLLSYEKVKPGISKVLFTFSCVALLGMFAINNASINMPSDYNDRTGFHGVQDERGANYQTNGLFGSRRMNGDLSSPLYQLGTTVPALFDNRMSNGEPLRDIVGTVASCYVGQFGLAAGAHVHIIDPLALTDPFLSHLPGRKGIPGHVVRPLPYGYATAVAYGDASLLAPSLLKLWRDVELVYRSNDLFTVPRMAAIWRLHTGEGAAMAKESGYSRMLATIPYPSDQDCDPPNNMSVFLPFWILSNTEPELAALRAMQHR